MRKIKFLALALLTVLLACNQAETGHKGPLEISLKQSTDVIPISGFVSSVEYIELKLNEAGISLGEVEAVKKIGDDWLIKHRQSGSSSFLRLNKNGAFIIELAGKKNKEIQTPLDIIEYKNGYAILAGNGIHEVAKDGKYIKQLVKGASSGSCFFEDRNQFYILNELKEGEIFEKAGNSSRSAENLPDRVQRMMYTSVQDAGKNQVHFFSTLSDKVYALENKNAEPVVMLSGDELPTFADVLEKAKDMDELETIKFLRESEHVIVRKYLENQDYIYLTYWVGSYSTTAILNKKTSETRYLGIGVNDIDGGIWERPLFLTSKNELVIPLSAYKIGGHKISNKKERHFARLQEKIAASGNPVLMLCKLK